VFLSIVVFQNPRNKIITTILKKIKKYTKNMLEGTAIRIRMLKGIPDLR